MATGGPRGWLRAGRVGRPHGLDGSFHVTGARPQLLPLGRELWLAPAASGLASPEPGAQAARRIERRAGHDARLILRLEGCADRAAAEALRGAGLFVDRALAPALEPDEWWAEDLEGCAVHDAGRPVGVVGRLLALPSCEVLEVVREGADAAAPPLLIPLVGDAVRSVDVQARAIDVDLGFLGEA